MAHKFKPEHWERLVGPERRRLMDPERVLDLLQVEPGSTVADIGAGPGFFTLPLAERVGAAGHVHALDVAPAMVDLLRQRDLPPQVEVQLSGERTLPLADGSVDLALLAFVFHELEDRAGLLREVTRVLRAHGRFALLEWVPRDEERGPPLEERVAEEDVVRALRSAGFEIADRRAMNESQYLIVSTRPRGGEQPRGGAHVRQALPGR